LQIYFLGPNTSEQAQGFIEAVQALSLDTDIWPLTVDVYFADDPDPTQPDEFAVTSQVDTDHFELRFRNDAPHFHNGPAAAHFDIPKFYRETVAHELGHVFSFALNEEGQNLIARLFNTTVDEEFPPEKPWQDRPGEAIAETFKDAFLPQAEREYSNRTHIQLNYPFFPLFRAIYRNAVTDGLLRDAEGKLGLATGTLGSIPNQSSGSGEGTTEDGNVFLEDGFSFGGGLSGDGGLENLFNVGSHSKSDTIGDVTPFDPVDFTLLIPKIGGTPTGFPNDNVAWDAPPFSDEAEESAINPGRWKKQASEHPHLHGGGLFMFSMDNPDWFASWNLWNAPTPDPGGPAEVDPWVNAASQLAGIEGMTISQAIQYFSPFGGSSFTNQPRAKTVAHGDANTWWLLIGNACDIGPPTSIDQLLDLTAGPGRVQAVLWGTPFNDNAFGTNDDYRSMVPSAPFTNFIPPEGRVVGSQFVGPGEIVTGESITGRRIRRRRISGSKIGP